MLEIFLILALIIMFIVFKKKFNLFPKKILTNNGKINPLEVLKTRLSDGEITKKEFNQIKKNLGI